MFYDSLTMVRNVRLGTSDAPAVRTMNRVAFVLTEQNHVDIVIKQRFKHLAVAVKKQYEAIDKLVINNTLTLKGD